MKTNVKMGNLQIILEMDIREHNLFKSIIDKFQTKITHGNDRAVLDKDEINFLEYFHDQIMRT
jgi:hypothetical protein